MAFALLNSLASDIQTPSFHHGCDHCLYAAKKDKANMRKIIYINIKDHNLYALMLLLLIKLGYNMKTLIFPLDCTC